MNLRPPNSVLSGVVASSIGLTSLLSALPSQAEVVLRDEAVTIAQAQKKPTLAEIAASNENFTVLTKLLKHVGAVNVLNNPNSGPYTIFAPTDAAFEALPKRTLRALLKNNKRSKDELRGILAYHALNGSLTSSQLESKRYVTEATPGKKLKIKKKEASGVRVNKANVIQSDIIASNGVIHVIDRVLIPRP